jgi:hypothetical protein
MSPGVAANDRRALQVGFAVRITPANFNCPGKNSFLVLSSNFFYLSHFVLAPASLISGIVTVVMLIRFTEDQSAGPNSCSYEAHKQSQIPTRQGVRRPKSLDSGRHGAQATRGAAGEDRGAKASDLAHRACRLRDPHGRGNSGDPPGGSSGPE